MSEERDQEQYAAYLAEQDAHEEALAQRAAYDEYEQHLAAAHRAGAREAYRVIVEELTEAGSNYESASRWLLGVDRHKAQISHSVVSEMLFRIEPIAARYAEPGEEKG